MTSKEKTLKRLEYQGRINIEEIQKNGRISLINKLETEYLKEIILKDLEILEILKKQIREWKIKPTKLWNREKKQINGYQIKALINLNEEQYDKLKEWLDNDK